MNKERMKEIIEYSCVGNVRGFGMRNLVNKIINHPEIESMFESENGINVVYTDGEYGECWYCTECGAGEVDEESSGHKEDCWHCGVELIWPTDRSEAQYEVVEYEYDSLGMYTSCEGSYDAMCGSGWCIEECKHFEGHEIEGRSIRCAYKFNKGSTK